MNIRGVYWMQFFNRIELNSQIYEVKVKFLCASSRFENCDRPPSLIYYALVLLLKTLPYTHFQPQNIRAYLLLGLNIFFSLTV